MLHKRKEGEEGRGLGMEDRENERWITEGTKTGQREGGGEAGKWGREAGWVD